MMNDWGTGYSAGGWVMMMLFWGLLAIGIVACVWYFARNSRVGQPNSALDILKTRYAKGEIDKKEFDEMRKDLQA